MDKAKLLRQRGGETRDVEIPDVGTIRVRGLTRAEVKACQDDDRDAFENQLIAAALVDPVMTPDEVAEWLDAAPAGDSVAVMAAVADLSGIAEGAAKSGVPGVRARQRR